MATGEGLGSVFRPRRWSAQVRRPSCLPRALCSACGAHRPLCVPAPIAAYLQRSDIRCGAPRPSRRPRWIVEVSYRARHAWPSRPRRSSPSVPPAYALQDRSYKGLGADWASYQAEGLAYERVLAPDLPAPEKLCSPARQPRTWACKQAQPPPAATTTMATTTA